MITSPKKLHRDFDSCKNFLPLHAETGQVKANHQSWLIRSTDDEPLISTEQDFLLRGGMSSVKPVQNVIGKLLSLQRIDS